jgi:hypothetical protein
MYAWLQTSPVAQQSPLLAEALLERCALLNMFSCLRLAASDYVVSLQLKSVLGLIFISAFIRLDHLQQSLAVQSPPLSSRHGPPALPHHAADPLRPLVLRLDWIDDPFIFLFIPSSQPLRQVVLFPARTLGSFRT